TACSLEFPLTF
nr:immunoglobulin light chain junction region [Macaca mulatta]